MSVTNPTISKVCLKCAESKPLGQFHRRTKSVDGRGSRCKSCVNAQQAEYREENREVLSERQRDYARRNPDKIRSANRLRHSGTTQEQYDVAFHRQNGMCAICCAPDGHAKGRGGTLHSDHNHITGAFRGLLCAPCNTALGLLSESVPNLRFAIEYLENNQ